MLAAINTFSIATQRIITPSVDFLIVGGGGGGGTGTFSNANGGGGAGGLVYMTGQLPGYLTITVGLGGAVSTSGQNSSIVSDRLNVIALGGGRGGGYTGGIALAGGSGGGSYGNGAGPTYGAGTVGQGYRGGAGDYIPAGGTADGGGGGGAGGVGVDGSYGGFTSGSGWGGGAGGPGLSYSISGTNVTYAGGGGGTGGTSGAGGSGGGGAGELPGLVNTGGGGGGNNIGGSGVVIIRYSDSFDAAPFSTGSPTVTVAGGYRIYKFTTSGTLTL